MGYQGRGWVFKVGGGPSSRQVKFNRRWSGVALLGMGSLQGARKGWVHQGEWIRGRDHDEE